MITALVDYMSGLFPLCHSFFSIKSLWHSRLYMTTAKGGGFLSFNKSGSKLHAYIKCYLVQAGIHVIGKVQAQGGQGNAAQIKTDSPGRAVIKFTA